MNCDLIRKNLGEYLDGEVSSTLQIEIKDHLKNCATCCAEHEELFQMHDILQLEPVTPPAGFGGAWRERIRNEASVKEEVATNNVVSLSNKTKKALKWYQQVPTWAAAAVILVVGVFFGLKQSLWQTSGADELSYSASQVDEGATYQLKILMVGTRSKEVQKILRDFSSSHEGGMAFTLRVQQKETAVFPGLALDEAKMLQEQLTKAGAKVKIIQE